MIHDHDHHHHHHEDWERPEGVIRCQECTQLEGETSTTIALSPGVSSPWTKIVREDQNDVGDEEDEESEEDGDNN